MVALGAVAAGLVLELRHPAGLAEAGDAGRAPRPAGRARPRGSARRPSDRLGSTPPARYCAAVRRVRSRSARRLDLDGDRVQVDDAVERVVALLQADPAAPARRGSCRGAASRASAACPRGCAACGRIERFHARACAPLCQVTPGAGARGARSCTAVSPFPAARRARPDEICLNMFGRALRSVAARPSRGDVRARTSTAGADPARGRPPWWLTRVRAGRDPRRLRHDRTP